MASSGKKKTTMAKLDRERRMRERRMDKQARKDARKQEAALGLEAPDEILNPDLGTTEEGAIETATVVRVRA
jgi:hypothetical protein